MHQNEILQKVLSNNDFITEMTCKLDSYLGQTDKEIIEHKLNEIFLNKADADGLDTVYDLMYEFVNENLPDHVNAQLYKDISQFINTSIDK